MIGLCLLHPETGKNIDPKNPANPVQYKPKQDQKNLF